MPVKLQASNLDATLISRIVQRWARVIGQKQTLIDLELDITATHLNGNPLRLEELLRADEGDFCHDVSGIRHHIDRETGKLTNLFSPRYSK